MDKILLNNMRFISHSGVLEEEKKNGQTFVVSMELDLPEVKAWKTDALEDTIDYSKVFEIVRKTVEEIQCDLIEYMAGRIIRNVMSAFGEVERIKVKIEKPLAPIEGDFESMGVEIARSRKDLEGLA
ncbi:MAG: dihydroneopterin aldolase [Clostridiales bacterium]|nr:dihydroneopterin aldolase [Clostridiales bacterium]